MKRAREAERTNTYNEYIDRIGELVNGTVKRLEHGDIVVDLGHVEAILLRSQQARNERYSKGERIRVVIINVLDEPNGPQVEVSRTSPELLKRMFEIEVPEISDGTVLIKSCSRAPGERAKMAVTSTARDVNPVEACLGTKGSRRQSVIRQLRGETIDIIEWSDDLAVFAARALTPATVKEVRVIAGEGAPVIDAIVSEDQFALARGKGGQNVQLASRLVGGRIEVIAENEVEQNVRVTPKVRRQVGGSPEVKGRGQRRAPSRRGAR